MTPSTDPTTCNPATPDRTLECARGPFTASKKRDDLSTHESRQDFKHLPAPKPAEAVQPRSDGKQGGKPMPAPFPKLPPKVK